METIFVIIWTNLDTQWVIIGCFGPFIWWDSDGIENFGKLGLIWGQMKSDVPYIILKWDKPSPNLMKLFKSSFHGNWVKDFNG